MFGAVIAEKINLGESGGRGRGWCVLLQHQMGLTIAATVLSKVGDELSFAFAMFWEIVWALIFGFALSALVSKRRCTVCFPTIASLDRARNRTLKDSANYFEWRTSGDPSHAGASNWTRGSPSGRETRTIKKQAAPRVSEGPGVPGEHP